MKFLKAIISVSLLATLFCSMGQAQRVELLIDEGNVVKDAPESVSLEYRYREGELRRYDVTVQGDGIANLPGQKEEARVLSHSTMVFIQHVKSQSPSDGFWKIEWTMIKGTLTIPEFGDTLITVPPTNFEMDKYGAVRKIKGIEDLTVSPGLPQGNVFGSILGQLRALGFPRKPVKVGDKWEDKYTVSIPDQDKVEITSVSEVQGFERVRKTDCLKIRSTYEIPFALKMPDPKAKPADAKDPAGDQPPDEQPSSEPVILKGKEKAEYWTYFAYKEGKLLQSFGTIELSADIQTPGAPAKPEPKVEEKPVAPDPTAENPDATPPMPKHDLYVKFQMISKYNPDIPKSLEEVEVE